MALKTKILVGYGVAFALMGLVVAWAIANIVSLGKATDAILRENYRSILAAENMVEALERQDSGILLILLGDADRGDAQLRENEAVFFEWLARAKDNVTVQGEAELIRQIQAGYAAFRQRCATLKDGGQARGAAGLYHEGLFPLFRKVRDACKELRRLNEQTMYEASVRAGQVARRAIWSTGLVAAAGLVIALAFSLALAERVTRPLRRFMEASRRIADGHYDVAVPVETGDELGRLAGEFNRMAAQLGRFHEMNIDQIIAEKNKGEAVLASIEDGLVVFDTSLAVTGINPAARRMLALDLNEAPGDCDHLLTGPPVCELIRRTVASGVRPDIPDEQRILTLADHGRHHHYLFTITVIQGRDHGLCGAVLVLRDVTRLKEVERLKSDFVMAASHELRTPLTSLGMSVDLLLENAAATLADRDRDLLQAAHEEVHRMKALVNDLLDLSKIEAGRIEMEFEQVAVPTLVDHARAVFKSQLDIKQVDFAVTLAPDLPKVRADANKITWVLTNLISNALRYVADAGHIGLTAHRVGPHVHLSVRDDGPGIPVEYHSKIFQKFVRVQEQPTGGTGLGLAICKEIVRAHGGTIWVESAPGRGSIFTFTLPVCG